MWPKSLDLTRDECRGMLRRLGMLEIKYHLRRLQSVTTIFAVCLIFIELESYSKVVGTFRAQGNLNDVKAKILKDLRDVFHIPDERHKAEVRRAVNDEALSTVAKA